MSTIAVVTVVARAVATVAAAVATVAVAADAVAAFTVAVATAATAEWEPTQNGRTSSRMGTDIEWTIGVSAWRRAAAGQFTNLFVFYVALDTSFKHFC